MILFKFVDSRTPRVRKNASTKIIIIAGKLINVPASGLNGPDNACGMDILKPCNKPLK